MLEQAALPPSTSRGLGRLGHPRKLPEDEETGIMSVSSCGQKYEGQQVFVEYNNAFI